jgi:hypothetical protein
MSGEGPELVLLHHGDEPPVKIVPAGRWREWMQGTPERFANRCLPLLVANQAGWVLLNPHPFGATWNGGSRIADLTVAYDDAVPDAGRIAASHFGSGIVTFIFRCVFRTPDGYNILARGPANAPKDGVAPLEGIVETDWAVVPFTMNWKLTRPGTVRFEADEPFCQVVPQRRGELESFEPSVRSFDDHPDLGSRSKAWAATRMLVKLGRASAERAGEGDWRRVWMPDYFKGHAPTGETGAEHQTQLRLRHFE